MSRATTHTPSALKTQLRICLIAFSEMQAEYKRPLRCAQLCGISQAWRFGYIVFPNREHIAAIWLAGLPGLDARRSRSACIAPNMASGYHQEFAYHERGSPLTYHREHRSGQMKYARSHRQGVPGTMAR